MTLTASADCTMVTASLPVTTAACSIQATKECPNAARALADACMHNATGEARRVLLQDLNFRSISFGRRTTISTKKSQSQKLTRCACAADIAAEGHERFANTMARVLPTAWKQPQQPALQNLHARVEAKCRSAAADFARQAAPLWLPPSGGVCLPTAECAQPPHVSDMKVVARQREELAAEAAQLKASEAEWQHKLNAAEAEAAVLNPQPGTVPLLGLPQTELTLSGLSDRMTQGRTALQQYMGLVSTDGIAKPHRAETHCSDATKRDALDAQSMLQRFE